jgi:phage shock protein PspC (stress-responsive transcriptional regulator)
MSEGKWVGGVCAGLAHKFGTQAIIVRMIYLIGLVALPMAANFFMLSLNNPSFVWFDMNYVMAVLAALGMIGLYVALWMFLPRIETIK